MLKIIAHKKDFEITSGKLTLQDDLLERRINELMFYAKQLRSLSRTLVFYSLLILWLLLFWG
jgi:hypothetical protein